MKQMLLDTNCEKLAEKLYQNYLVYIAYNGRFSKVLNPLALKAICKIAPKLFNLQGFVTTVNPVKSRLQNHSDDNFDIQSDKFVFAYDFDIYATQNFTRFIIDRLNNALKAGYITDYQIYLSPSKRYHLYLKPPTSVRTVQSLTLLKSYKANLLRRIFFESFDSMAICEDCFLDKITPIQWVVWAEEVYCPLK